MPFPISNPGSNTHAVFSAALSDVADPQEIHHRMPASQELFYFQGLGVVRLDQAYSDYRGKIADVLQLLATTGTGRALLADLTAFTAQRGGLAIGPEGAFDHHDIEHFGGLVLRGHGEEVVWDFKKDANDLLNDFCGHAAYSSLVRGLVASRNYAAHRLGVGIPMLKVEDVQHAFLAELAVRATPAVDPARAGGAFLDRVGYDVGVTPAWRDPLFFDGLDGVMPAWLTPEARKHRDDLRELLYAIARTYVGLRVLQDLRVYARSGGVMLIHCSNRGIQGIRLSDRNVIWLFDRSALAAQAKSDGLSSSGRQASGALLELLRARGLLADKLGMMKQEVDMPATQKLFEKQVLGSHAHWSGARAPTVRTDREGATNQSTEIPRDARALAASMPTSQPTAPVAANAPRARPNEYSPAPESRPDN